MPLGRDETSFTLELTSRFVGESIAKAASRDRHDAGHEDEHKNQRSREESLGECHVPRD